MSPYPYFLPNYVYTVCINPPLHFLRESHTLSSCAPLPIRCAHLRAGICRLPNPAQRASTGLRTLWPPFVSTCVEIIVVLTSV